MTTLPPSLEFNRVQPWNWLDKKSLENSRLRKSGAGNETRTRDPNLGKVVLYQLSYSRSVNLVF
jgi:hypothetical protein